MAQAFPDAWHSAKKIKVLYGVEAYFINDVDDRVVVHGDKEQDFTGDIVCFDIETTGLADVITEIGAVVLRNGRWWSSSPRLPIPERPLDRKIVEFTGITDEMLRGAPSQAEAINAFLDFVGDRPLAAHNAEFDMGFIAERCRRMGRPFDSTSIDTLILAQNLLPELGKYKLDIVAEHRISAQPPPGQRRRGHGGLYAGALFPDAGGRGSIPSSRSIRLWLGCVPGARPAASPST